MRMQKILLNKEIKEHGVRENVEEKIGTEWRRVCKLILAGAPITTLSH
jgi:hypothetical protein